MIGAMIRALTVFLVLSAFEVCSTNNVDHHLHPQSWHIPTNVMGTGHYLCTCSRTAVGEDMMLPDPHAVTRIPGVGASDPLMCSIDDSSSHQRFACAYFKEYNLEQFLQSSACHPSGARCRPMRVIHSIPEKSLAEGLSLFNSASIDYFGISNELPMPKDGLTEFNADLCDLRFPDSFADFLIVGQELVRVAKLEKALTEMYRVLRPGGIAFISVPQIPSQPVTMESGLSTVSSTTRGESNVDQSSVRVIGADFLSKLESVGFFVDHTTPKEFYQKHFAALGEPVKFKNFEFTSSYNESGLFFVYKPSTRHPKPVYLRRHYRIPSTSRSAPVHQE